MELAVQLREAGQLESLEGVAEHLTEFYEDSDLDAEDFLGLIPKEVQRIYVGDEFCVHRLPDLVELEAAAGEAAGKGWDLTLLTPPVTDDGLEKCSRLFRFLEGESVVTEVVVNDWGLLCLLRENHPSLAAAAGRLLNKGLKDPRLVDPDAAADLSEDTKDLLDGCTFDTPRFRDKLREWDVRRLERDLLPYGEPRVQSPEGIITSVYFPFGYVSTGRVCWIASFTNRDSDKFTPLSSCHASCDGLLLEMGCVDSSFRVFGGGNTVFYLYPLSLLRAFLKDPTHDKIRLVYQGLAI